MISEKLPRHGHLRVFSSRERKWITNDAAMRGEIGLILNRSNFCRTRLFTKTKNSNDVKEWMYFKNRRGKIEDNTNATDDWQHSIRTIRSSSMFWSKCLFGFNQWLVTGRQRTIGFAYRSRCRLNDDWTILIMKHNQLMDHWSLHWIADQGSQFRSICCQETQFKLGRSTHV